MSFSNVYSALRRNNRGQYLLLSGCCFFSVLLITAYVCMMRSPTILEVLPEGGDSRKQVMMVFVLTVIGCGVFTTYASGLFFREKSRETGLFLALGVSRKQLKREIWRELAVLAVVCCAAGALLGAPLALGIWQMFRLFVVDSQEMPLRFDPESYVFALIFSSFVIVMLFLMAGRFVRRTDIIDVIYESHRSEPVRDVPRWYGAIGIALTLGGAFLGYIMPSVFVRGLHWYPPEGLTAVFYIPALVGVYMILLHTVVNGWRQGRNRYRQIIATSMMKFQGRQTVRNMLVMTLLIAGAYFASFYTPMLGTGAFKQIDERPVDYVYHYRADQDIPGLEDVEALAEAHGVKLTSWAEAAGAELGVDGYAHIEKEAAVGVTYEKEYRELLTGRTFLPESAYNTLTGQSVDIQPGTITGIMGDEGDGLGIFGGDATHITNMVTGKEMDVSSTEDKLNYSLLFGRFVMDDADYVNMTQGLDESWLERFVFFNVSGDNYSFAKALFDGIVDRSGTEVFQRDAYDRIEELIAERDGERYPYNRENLAEMFGEQPLEPNDRNSSSFRNYWKYMPLFRVLDRNDFVRNMAVFLMLFIFIAIVCFSAVFVIAFTRCMTIALVNAHVYDELRKLGASDAYLYDAVRGQVSRVFLVPAIAGTGIIYAFYFMIMYFNGSPFGITPSERAGLISCLLLIAAVSLLIYVVYLCTKRKVCQALNIKSHSAWHRQRK